MDHQFILVEYLLPFCLRDFYAEQDSLVDRVASCPDEHGAVGKNNFSKQQTDTGSFLELLSSIKQNRADGLDGNVQIQKNASVFDVIQIILQFYQTVFHRFAIRIIDLCPARKSGSYNVSGFVKRHYFGNFLDKERAFGSWSDDCHFAF